MSEKSQPQQPYRGGRHRIDDDDFLADDYDYDDARTQESPAVQPQTSRSRAAAAAASAGGGVSATDRDSRGSSVDTPEPQATTAAAGKPVGDDLDPQPRTGTLRPLAIVLLIIGVCLVGLGIYFLAGGNSAKTSNSDGGAVASSTAPAADNNGVQPSIASGQPAQSGAPGQPASAPGGTAPADPARSGQPAPGPTPGQPAPGEPAQPNAVGQPNGGVDKRAARVAVVNNSNVPNLASDLQNKLDTEGWGKGQTGNAPENEFGVWEKTTVYYDQGNAEQKAAAEQLAKEHGWVAMSRDDRAKNLPGGLVVVATETAR